ncbi:MAG: Maf family nucleotide pyrophosphatase [Flavobacteriales bacterium]
MELIDKVQQYTFVLASKSPRRRDIFNSLGLRHVIRTKEVDESFPAELKADEIPIYLSKKKAEAQADSLGENEILVTADTVVWINDHVLNKPETMDEAKAMLQEISGTSHYVYTGVCLTTKDRSMAFAEGTEVKFHPLTEKEIDYYLERYRPLDKAGAYGIQEFIGYIGIEKVEGDFYNVVGFPVQRFWKELDTFLR